MKPSDQDFAPNWVCPPGATIQDILNGRNQSAEEFSAQSGLPSDYVSGLLEGRETISLDTARTISDCLGAPVEFWMSRDYQYREASARIDGGARDWIRRLPLNDMIQYKWLDRTPLPSEELSACLKFFNVHDVPSWHATYSDVINSTNFRTSKTFESTPEAVAAWLRKGQIDAEEIQCANWDAEVFSQQLHAARKLTKVKDPDKFLPSLRDLCAAAGVAIVVVREPTGCRASGATQFLNDSKAMLLLSFRYRSDDHFWFSFFHEAGHLILHKTKSPVIEYGEEPDEAQEREANSFAESVLIPDDARDEFNRLSANTEAVLRFSIRIGIAPGIVVGQLQHKGKIRRDQLNKLKRRYAWS